MDTHSLPPLSYLASHSLFLQFHASEIASIQYYLTTGSPLSANFPRLISFLTLSLPLSVLANRLSLNTRALHFWQQVNKLRYLAISLKSQAMKSCKLDNGRNFYTELKTDLQEGPPQCLVNWSSEAPFYKVAGLTKNNLFNSAHS